MTGRQKELEQYAKEWQEKQAGRSHQRTPTQAGCLQATPKTTMRRPQEERQGLMETRSLPRPEKRLRGNERRRKAKSPNHSTEPRALGPDKASLVPSWLCLAPDSMEWRPESLQLEEESTKTEKPVSKQCDEILVRPPAQFDDQPRTANLLTVKNMTSCRKSTEVISGEEGCKELYQHLVTLYPHTSLLDTLFTPSPTAARARLLNGVLQLPQREQLEHSKEEDTLSGPTSFSCLQGELLRRIKRREGKLREEEAVLRREWGTNSEECRVLEEELARQATSHQMDKFRLQVEVVEWILMYPFT